MVQPARPPVLSASKVLDKTAELADLVGTCDVFKVASVIKSGAFLDCGRGKDLFVHYTGIQGEGRKTLAMEELVQFTITQGQKGPQAVDVARL